MNAGRALKDAIADLRSDLADQVKDRPTMGKVIDAAGAEHLPSSIPLVAQEAATSATPDDPQENNLATASPALRMSSATNVQRTWNSDDYACDTPAELSMDMSRLIAVMLERALFEAVFVGPMSDFVCAWWKRTSLRRSPS